MTAAFAKFGALENLEALLASYEAKSIFLVTGRSSYEACGAKAVVDKALLGRRVTRFSDFDINPKIEDGIKGAKLAHEVEADLILAVGGGSPMDIAKLVKAFLPNIDGAQDIVFGNAEVLASDIPLIAVPTTAGSGSEATHFAVVYIGKDKYSLASPHLLPDGYILDGSLLKSASPYQRAVNGLDAMAQAIEGAWAGKSTEHTRALSYDAVERLVKHLPGMVSGGSDEALQEVMIAANLAGQVINVTKTTAAHAFSYAFTGYHDIPHGHAVWMTLPAIFEKHINAPASQFHDPRGADHAQTVLKHLCKILDMEPTNCKAKLQDFMRSIDLEPDMIRMGASDVKQREFLSQQVNAERMGNNPIMLSPEDIADIFLLNANNI